MRTLASSRSKVPASAMLCIATCVALSRSELLIISVFAISAVVTASYLSHLRRVFAKTDLRADVIQFSALIGFGAASLFFAAATPHQTSLQAVLYVLCTLVYVASACAASYAWVRHLGPPKPSNPRRLRRWNIAFMGAVFLLWALYNQLYVDPTEGPWPVRVGAVIVPSLVAMGAYALVTHYASNRRATK